MDESKIPDQGVTLTVEDGFLCEVKYFSQNKTCVFWNMDYYPIPDGVAPLDVIRNIKSALHQMGFRWWLIETRAYGDAQIHDFYKAGIYGTSDNSDAIRIPIDMISLATLSDREPSNFVVITKLTPKSQLLRVLQSLKSRNNVSVFVELPDNTALNSIDSLVNSTQVIGGIKRPAGHVYPWQLDEDAFRWTIATRQLPANEEDACSYDWSMWP